MKDLEHARALANALVRVGKGAGKKVTALLTDMDSPLGRTVGNAIETREAIEVLHGRGPRDLVECTLALGTEMLELAGAAPSAGEARAMLEKSIAKGDAVRTLEKMIERHHGDPKVASSPARLEIAKEAVDILATESGIVRSIHALEVGLVGVALGAGRTRADQAVDPGVGIEILKKPGEGAKKGEAVARVFVRDRASAEAVRERLENAFEIGEAPAPRPLVLERIS